MEEQGTTREQIERTMMAVRRLYEALNALDWSVAKDLGVTRSDLQGLLMLEEGRRRAGDIAQGLGMSPGAITALLDRLQKAGLIERHRSESDRRVVEIDLTALGRERLGRIYGATYAACASSLRAHEDIDVVALALDGLASVLERQRDELNKEHNE